MFKFLIALLITSAAFADVIPVSLPEPSHTDFSSIQDAAVAGLHQAMLTSTKEEYAGVVFQCDNTFGFTEPVSNKSEDKFAIRVQFPARCKLVALFHTHPYNGDEYTDQFSPPDVDMAQQLKVKSYIYVVDAKHIREYDPSRDISYTDMKGAVKVRTPGLVLNLEKAL